MRCKCIVLYDLGNATDRVGSMKTIVLHSQNFQLLGLPSYPHSVNPNIQSQYLNPGSFRSKSNNRIWSLGWHLNEAVDLELLASLTLKESNLTQNKFNQTKLKQNKMFSTKPNSNRMTKAN